MHLMILSAALSLLSLTPGQCWDGSVGEGTGTARVVLSTTEADPSLTIYGREDHRFRLAEIDGESGSFVMEGISGVSDDLLPRRVELRDDGNGGFEGSYIRDGEPRPLKLAPHAESAVDPAFLGPWKGRLEAFGLSLVWHFDAGDCGVLTVRLDSPDQGATGIPVTSARVAGRQVEIGMLMINASFAGELSADGSRIDGIFSQNGMDLPLKLSREGEPGPARPQTPQPPYPYRTTEVEIENPSAEISLAGNLVIPDGDGPFPTVVFITGSGAQDRDESLAGHKPFAVLSDYLARAGIASLRYDDRGVGAVPLNPH